MNFDINFEFWFQLYLYLTPIRLTLLLILNFDIANTSFGTITLNLLTRLKGQMAYYNESPIVYPGHGYVQENLVVRFNVHATYCMVSKSKCHIIVTTLVL